MFLPQMMALNIDGLSIKVMTEKQHINGKDVWFKIEPWHVNVITPTLYQPNTLPFPVFCRNLLAKLVN